MGTPQSTNLNTDTELIPTSAEFADAGDGVSRWYHWRRSANGADATQGSTTDVANVNVDATPATVVGLLKGIITTLVSILGALTSSNLLNARTTALATTLLVKSSAGTLSGFQGYTTADGFVMLFEDADGVIAGGAQAVEVIPIVDPAAGGIGGPFSLDFGERGLAFATGLTIAFSSTAPLYTAGAPSMFVSAQYE